MGPRWEKNHPQEKIQVPTEEQQGLFEVNQNTECGILKDDTSPALIYVLILIHHLWNLKNSVNVLSLKTLKTDEEEPSWLPEVLTS